MITIGKSDEEGDVMRWCEAVGDRLVDDVIVTITGDRIVNVKVDPAPTVLRTEISPPISSTRRLQMWSPRPIMRDEREILLSVNLLSRSFSLLILSVLLHLLLCCFVFLYLILQIYATCYYLPAQTAGRDSQAPKKTHPLTRLTYTHSRDALPVARFQSQCLLQISPRDIHLQILLLCLQIELDTHFLSADTHTLLLRRDSDRDFALWGEFRCVAEEIH